MELIDYLRFLSALLVVLGLIYLLAQVARRAGLGGNLSKLGAARRRRLSVVDTLMLDGRRRLVLVRRDDTEHLLLLGHERDSVVEQSIIPPDDGSPDLDAEPQRASPTAGAGGRPRLSVLPSRADPTNPVTPR